MTLDQLLQQSPQIAAVLLAASRMLPKTEALWRFLPSQIRWLPPVLLVALPQVADALGVAKSPLDLGSAVLLALGLLVPGARSAAHAQLAKDAPPATPKTGAGAAPLALLLGLALLSPHLTACSSAQLPTTPQVLDARKKTELAVALAGQALPLVKLEVDRLVEAGTIPPAAADKARDGLAKADLVLAKAEAWLAGKADAPGREEALQAIDGVALAASVARAGGGKLPGLTDRALELAREVVGDGQ